MGSLTGYLRSSPTIGLVWLEYDQSQPFHAIGQSPASPSLSIGYILLPQATLTSSAEFTIIDNYFSMHQSYYSNILTGVEVDECIYRSVIENPVIQNYAVANLHAQEQSQKCTHCSGLPRPSNQPMLRSNAMDESSAFFKLRFQLDETPYTGPLIRLASCRSFGTAEGTVSQTKIITNRLLLHSPSSCCQYTEPTLVVQGQLPFIAVDMVMGTRSLMHEGSGTVGFLIQSRSIMTGARSKHLTQVLCLASYIIIGPLARRMIHSC